MNGTRMTAIPTSSEAGALVLSPTMLPRSENIEFRESSFFSRHSALPSPNEVRNRARLDEGLPTRTTKTGGRRRNVVLFPDVGLVVKWGSNISIGEGQCLWACQHLLPGVVPVPEIFGWYTNREVGKDEVFLYMEYVQGITLEDCWSSLSSEDKHTITSQLREMLIRMRQVQQDANDMFLGRRHLLSLWHFPLVTMVSRST